MNINGRTLVEEVEQEDEMWLSITQLCCFQWFPEIYQLHCWSW